MTILYTDTRHEHRIDATEKAELVRLACGQYMHHWQPYDLVHIDLRGDVEGCSFYDIQKQERVATLGGAAAWATYKVLASHFPEINHHFTPAAPVLFPGE